VEHSGDKDREQYFYYNMRWQLLEVRNADDKAQQQFVWGAQYIDEAICMDVDTDTSGSGYGICIDSGSHRYRYLQDANYNVVGLWDDDPQTGGRMLERYEYDAYGTCRIYKAWDSTAGCEARSVVGASLAVGGGNPIRYCGYYFDEETGLYHVRNRMYSAGLQRWLQRDPAGFVDGPNMLEYVGSNPEANADPEGTKLILVRLCFGSGDCTEVWVDDGMPPQDGNPPGTSSPEGGVPPGFYPVRPSDYHPNPFAPPGGPFPWFVNYPPSPPQPPSPPGWVKPVVEVGTSIGVSAAAHGISKLIGAGLGPIGWIASALAGYFGAEFILDWLYPPPPCPPPKQPDLVLP
jgi:RHS repeat-associated protein